MKNRDKIPEILQVSLKINMFNILYLVITYTFFKENLENEEKLRIFIDKTPNPTFQRKLVNIFCGIFSHKNTNWDH